MIFQLKLFHSHPNILYYMSELELAIPDLPASVGERASDCAAAATADMLAGAGDGVRIGLRIRRAANSVRIDLHPNYQCLAACHSYHSSKMKMNQYQYNTTLGCPHLKDSTCPHHHHVYHPDLF